MPDFGDYSILTDGFEFVKKKVVSRLVGKFPATGLYMQWKHGNIMDISRENMHLLLHTPTK